LNATQKLRNILPHTDKKQLNRKMSVLLSSELSECGSETQSVMHLLCTTNNEEGCRLLVKAGDTFMSSFRVEGALACTPRPSMI
jgi:hypothetical protein